MGSSEYERWLLLEQPPPPFPSAGDTCDKSDNLCKPTPGVGVSAEDGGRGLTVGGGGGGGGMTEWGTCDWCCWCCRAAAAAAAATAAADTGGKPNLGSNCGELLALVAAPAVLAACRNAGNGIGKGSRGRGRGPPEFILASRSAWACLKGNSINRKSIQ